MARQRKKQKRYKIILFFVYFTLTLHLVLGKYTNNELKNK